MIRFYSKRNDVILDHGIVIKTFKRQADFKKEQTVYTKLEASNFQLVPQIVHIDSSKRQLSIEYLEGPTVLEELELLEKSSDVERGVTLLVSIFNWLDAFYKIFSDEKQIMGDVNLRNFIWYKGQVYGIDFEKSEPGDMIQEKAEVLARYLLYNPVESDFKIKVTNRVIADLFESDGFEDLIGEKVTAIKERRSHLH